MTDLLTEVAHYYSEKLAQFGSTPQGVDWNGEAGQILRFKQLARLFPETGGFSVNDLGCGYGACFDYLKGHYNNLDYLGIDVSESMVDAARKRHQGQTGATYIVSDQPDRIADYSIVSGIFNVRLGRSPEEWHSYIQTVLDQLNAFSRKGFAFNCLTSFSDPEKMRPDLYYADSTAWFSHCVRNYSRHVALLHDYGLYEFTMLVKKTP